MTTTTDPGARLLELLRDGGRLMDELREQIQRERAQLLEQLRAMLPGLEGRLEGPHLYVTPEEAELIRALTPHPRQPRWDSQSLALLDVLVEDPDGC